jgi:hypothetical protein
VFELLGISRTACGVAMAALLTAAVVVIELLYPSQWTVALSSVEWHPVACGLLIGSLQLPLLLGVNQGLGASTSFAVVVANVLPTGSSAYFKAFRGGLLYWWQVCVCVCGVCGVCVCVTLCLSLRVSPCLSVSLCLCPGTAAALRSMSLHQHAV